MGIPTELVEELPTGLRWDPADGLVRWEDHANGVAIHRAATETIFRQSTFLRLTLLRRIDKQRRASAEKRAGKSAEVIPMRRRDR